VAEAALHTIAGGDGEALEWLSQNSFDLGVLSSCPFRS